MRSRYRYESHGLRFDVKRPTESLNSFRSRINAVARDEERDNQSMAGGDSNWLIGTQTRHKGSLHGDIWLGTAADLASRGFIGVYPAVGWWKTRPALQRFNRAARYAMVVSLKAPDVDIDLYTAVANLVRTPLTIQSRTGN